ncbi:hypothetical protein EV421DRAFT_1861496 [Armillaria borealis]|uniref:Uncharacterized protein n=1 Tax=Armillaria borealis TaxID=47425 RepID=A0AA39MDR9_9AGAR|nr:hypothetical protein EV421DRAFT_1861496 [Armillaria borealis]
MPQKYTPFDAEVPDPNKLPRSKWGGLLQLAVAKVDSSFYFQLECEDHIVRLVKGDRAPAPPPTSRRTADLSPEWYKIVYSTLLRGEVEVRDDADLELFVWAYLYSEANERVHIWRGLRAEMIQLTRPFFAAHLPSAYTDNSGLLKAASAIASVFATKTPVEPPPLTPSSMDENKPPLLCPSSSSSHTGDVDSDDDNRDRPFRRRKHIVSSDTVDL